MKWHKVIVLDNFPVVLTIAIELLKRETLLYTKSNKQQLVKAATKLQEIRHLVNYNDIHNKMWPLKSSDMIKGFG